MNIFVSSTYEDLKDYRSAVRAAILELGHTPIMMEDFIPSGYLPKEECCRLVEKAYVFIGIYAHRYGYIPAGDRVSITEQEYLHAKKKLDKKNIFCFVLDERVKWPEEQKENIPELKIFRGKILAENVVKIFRSPEELRAQVTKILVSILPPEEPILETLINARKTTFKIGKTERLNAIYELIKKNENKELKSEALQIIINLISSNFQPSDILISSRLIYLTIYLLKKYISIDRFAYFANKFTKKIRIRNYLKKVSLISIFFVLIGFFIGFLSYKYNWAGARVKYLAPQNAYKMDVIEWLKNQYHKNIQYDRFDSKETRKAIVSLSLIKDVDPRIDISNDLDVIVNYIDALTRPEEVDMKLLEETINILQEIYAYTKYNKFQKNAELLKVRLKDKQDRRKAIEIWELIKEQYQDSLISNKKLLADCEFLWNKYQKYIFQNEVLNKIT